MWAYGTVSGLAQGMKGVIQGSAYAHYFGRTALGEIKGWATTVSVAATTAGPYLFALGFEAFGSYVPILVLSAVPPLLLALALPRLSPYRADGVVR
ncbi:MAG: hypothetical protein BRC58_00010 [Cyanobacteria bacterium QS_8_64_29]|nr:MAG: hypothetical protein BRC58_00010 [Cyanobacteria bacterium QS_8_64_29]